MFDISYLDARGERRVPWQNSWGFTTRTIGVAIMVHGDDRGLVLPPRVAPKQAVVVPIVNARMGDDDRAALLAACRGLADALRRVDVRVHVDARADRTPGWKYNHWELKGVPLRLEVGPRDVAKGACLAVRRDADRCGPGADGARPGREEISFADAAARVPALLETMQADLLSRATAERDAVLMRCATMAEVVDAVAGPDAGPGRMALAPWCEDECAEDAIKAATAQEGLAGAKSLCMPHDQPAMPAGQLCVCPCGTPAKSWGLFARSF